MVGKYKVTHALYRYVKFYQLCPGFVGTASPQSEDITITARTEQGMGSEE